MPNDSSVDPGARPGPKSNRAFLIGGGIIIVALLPTMLYVRGRDAELKRVQATLSDAEELALLREGARGYISSLGGSEQQVADVDHMPLEELQRLASLRRADGRFTSRPAAVDERYRSFASDEPATLELISGNFKAVVDRFAADEATVQAKLAAAETALAEGNSHLRRALADPFDTPFVDPERQTTQVHPFLGTIEPLVADYRQHATHSDEVQETIVAAVNASLQQWWTGQAVTTAETVRDLADRHNDPLLWYCVVLFTPESERIEPMRKASASLQTREVDPLLEMLIQTKYSRHREQTKTEELYNANKAAVASFRRLFEREAAGEKSLPIVLSMYFEVIDSYGAMALRELAVHLADPAGAPVPDWPIQLAISEYCHRAAWHYRGGGFVSEIADDNLDRFHRLIEQAAAHGQLAWAEAPQRQEIATKLLRIERAGSCTYRNVYEWFRFAIAENLNNFAAFDDFSIALEPRWGGSEEALLWFANMTADCLDQPGEIGYYFWYPISRVARDHSYAMNLGKPRATSTVDKLIAHLRTQPANANCANSHDRRYLMTLRLLWDAGQYENLSWFLTTYPRETTEADERLMLIDVNFLKRFSACATEGNSEAWREVHKNLLCVWKEVGESHVEAALRALDELETTVESQESREMLAACRQLAQWQSRYLKYEPVRLTFDAALSGWSVYGNVSETSDASVKFEIGPDNKSVSFQLLSPFRAPLVLEADLMHEPKLKETFLDRTAAYMIVSAVACNDLHHEGIFSRWSAGQRTLRTNILPDCGSDLNSQVKSYDEQRTKTRLRIEYLSDTLTVYLDDQVQSVHDAQHADTGVIRLGAANYAEAWPDGKAVGYRISNVRLQRIKPAPFDVRRLRGEIEL